MWGNDFMHPLDLGHKTIADMAVYLLQQTALQVRPVTSWQPAVALLQPGCVCFAAALLSGCTENKSY